MGNLRIAHIAHRATGRAEQLKSELAYMYVVTDDGRAVSGIPRSIRSLVLPASSPTSHNIIPMPSMAEQDALGISIEFFSFIAKTMYKIRFRIPN